MRRRDFLGALLAGSVVAALPFGRGQIERRSTLRARVAARFRRWAQGLGDGWVSWDTDWVCDYAGLRASGLTAAWTVDADGCPVAEMEERAPGVWCWNGEAEATGLVAVFTDEARLYSVHMGEAGPHPVEIAEVRDLNRTGWDNRGQYLELGA